MKPLFSPIDGIRSLRLLAGSLIATAAFISGCGYMQLVGSEIKESVAAINLQAPLTAGEPEADIDAVLSGSVRGAVPGNGPIAVVAFATVYSTEQNYYSDQLVTHILLPQPGPYALFVPAGRYKIMAFVDTDRNFILQPQEYAGGLHRLSPLAVRSNQVVSNLDIELQHPGSRRFDFPVSLQKLPLRQTSQQVLQYGGTIALDNEIFQRKYASMGLWRPADFIEKIGVHLYALEPFDPTKTPLLFVHGINGTPRDWQYLAKGIDRSRFQPWFYYYPSGMRLSLLSDVLYEKIKAVHRRYPFEKLVVVAHSMGGLISRAFINRYEASAAAGNPRVFVSISTPWGGDKSARTGLENAPVKVPSWRDIAVGSDFVEALCRSELPPYLRFYIFFSYGGNRRFQREASDGTVTLQSQLDPRAKSQARRIEGFYEDHITVLSSSDVEKKLNEILGTLSTGRVLSADQLSPKPNTAASFSRDAAGSTGKQRLPDRQDTAAYPTMSPAVKRYVRMLQSVDSGSKTEAARRIYRRRLRHPAIFDTAARQLRKGYRVNLADSAHIDAMAWMCNLLGMSSMARYRPVLQEVAQETPNRKIRKHALKGLRRLPP